jgi:hypothetical protein
MPNEINAQISEERKTIFKAKLIEICKSYHESFISSLKEDPSVFNQVIEFDPIEA